MAELSAKKALLENTTPSKGRRPQARSLARRMKILKVAREMITTDSIANLSLYDIAYKAEIPPSSLYHFFPKVEVLLQALVQEVFDAFDECVSRPVEEAKINHWSDITQVMEIRMQRYYQENEVARALILGQHLHVDILAADHQHDNEMGNRIESIYRHYYDLPKLPDSYNIFAIALQIADKVYAMSHQEFGNITATMAAEGFRAARAYLSLYLPEQMPRKSC